MVRMSGSRIDSVHSSSGIVAPRCTADRRTTARASATSRPRRVLRNSQSRSRDTFAADGQNQAQWVEHKRKVNAGKSWIKVGTQNISMFRNPGKDEYVVVTFEQDYKSNNLANVMNKRQYWIKEDGRWKIVYEGAI